MAMKKQFQNIKNFVQDINLTVVRGEKSDVLTLDLINAEKKVDLMKQACLSTEKKICSCLKSYGPGGDIDKRYKKLPEISLSQCAQEFGEQLGNDSVLGQALADVGEIQKNISRELVNYELEVEKTCLTSLNNFIENDIPNVIKSRKQLNKATSDMDMYRQRYHTAMRQSHQTTGSTATVAAANKAEALKLELEDATNKVEQSKDLFATEIFSFIAHERDIAQVYLQFLKGQSNYHKKALQVLEESIPKLEKIITDTSQKPLFGTCLEEHLRVTEREVAFVIEACVGWLLFNLNEEGLFRINGSASKVKKLKSALNANIIDYNEYARDPHSVAGCLKSYLRELPKPLLTFQMYPAWINAAKLTDSNSRLQAFWQVCNCLPKVNHTNLRYLIRFLAKYAANSESNKMTPQNIAIAMAPSLIWAPSVNGNEYALGANMTAANYHTMIVEALVNYADWFFPGDIDFVTPSILLPSDYKTLNGEVSTDNIHPIPFPRTLTSRSSKKPAPPAPSSSFSDKFLLERKGSLNGHAIGPLRKNQDHSPNSSPRKLCNDSLSEGVNDNTIIQSTNIISKSSSPLGEKSSSTSFTTGSLDRKQLRNSAEKNSANRKENRKSFVTVGSSNRALIKPSISEKPTLPPPTVPSIPIRPSLHSIERPSVPPPDRPSRDSNVFEMKLPFCENNCDIQSDFSHLSLDSSLTQNDVISSENKNSDHHSHSHSHSHQQNVHTHLLQLNQTISQPEMVELGDDENELQEKEHDHNQPETVPHEENFQTLSISPKPDSNSNFDIIEYNEKAVNEVQAIRKKPPRPPAFKAKPFTSTSSNENTYL